MAEPTSVLTYTQIITKIAKELGIAYYGPNGDSKAMPPIDVHDLEQCKEIASDGIRQFIADAPLTGWRWRDRIITVTTTGTQITGTADSASTTTLVDAMLAETYDSDDELNGYYCYITGGTGEGSWAVITDYDATGTPGKITVNDWLDEFGNAGGTDPDTGSTFTITPVETVGGDIARYPLAENLSIEITGNIEYAENTAHSISIQWCNESFIRSRRSVSVNTGYPRYAALRPLEPRSNAIDPKRRWELILDPQPSSSETLEFSCKIIFNNLDLEAGVADSASSTTLVDGSREEGDDYFNGWKITILGGTGKDSYAIVTDYTGSSGTFTVADWLTAAGGAGGTDPDEDSVYIVEPANNLHPAGSKFDQAILSACLMEAELQNEDVNKNYIDKYITKDLPQAYMADTRSAPRKLGSMDVRKRNKVRGRTWFDVTTDHDM